MTRVVLAAVFIVLGLFIFSVATYGLFKFKYVLNRLHVAAKCDSLALMLICVGLMFLSSSLGDIFKLFFITVLVWLVNPAASHLIAKIEVETNPDISKECEVERW